MLKEVAPRLTRVKNNGGDRRTVILAMPWRPPLMSTRVGYHLLAGLGFSIGSERACLRHQGGIATTTHLRTNGSP
jgi:hypothetical protein